MLLISEVMIANPEIESFEDLVVVLKSIARESDPTLMFCAISQKLIGLLCVNACLQRLLTFVQVERYKGADAWEKAFTAFNLAQQDELWELAVEACDVMFLSEGPDALVALGHALWLGVTFPIDPEITVAMLQHLVEESPEEADTRAVAAAAAHYITSVRCGADDELTFFTSQMLASVADKHSHITDQSTFDLWRKTLKLDEPEVFLKKLSGAVDQLVDDKWWIDRDKIKAKLDNET
jgi:hypothetical protein